MGEFVKSQLGCLKSGTVVEVVLSGAASEVFLADDANLGKLERGDVSGFRGYGGPFDQSPIRLGVPSSGTWNVVVIPIGGTVTVTSVRWFAAA
jgi:Domain of unknown function (DUF1883)